MAGKKINHGGEIQMSFSVNTNIASLNGQVQLNKTQMSLQGTLARLTSGLRINSSADDAAGLAVANRFRMDNAGLQTGIRSANDATSRLQIEDGAMDNISNLLDRALTLATQAASDTFLGNRTTLDNEFQSVLSEITRSATSVALQTSGTSLGARSVFVGNTQISTAASVTYVSFNVSTAVDAQGLGISTQNITQQSSAATAITALQTAVGTLGTAQGTIGAAMNRLQFISSLSQTMSVAVAASESRIRDANIAEEAANLTKFNILNQSGLAALAQANQGSSSVLSLLR
ncbi:MAG: flagellin FliC [Acidobacteria bacterium]|nr:MAG: flagellin FliC [Acidobacteriota bacterium]